MGSELSNIDVTKLSKDQQEIIECIGMENYYKLSRNYGGQTIYIGRAKIVERQERDKKILDEFRKGASYKELAIKYRLSEIWIRKLVNGKKK